LAPFQLASPFLLGLLRDVSNLYLLQDTELPIRSSLP
jgi:hypothetical protein